MRNQKGFTLIELVVVIAILGILAAFALPRFADMTSNARAAAMNGLAGSMSSAAALAHAQCLVDSACSTTGASSTTLDGQAVTLSGGYPTADAAGIEAALSSHDGFTGAAAAGVWTYDFTSGTIASCNATYTQATHIATATTGGC